MSAFRRQPVEPSAARPSTRRRSTRRIALVAAGVMATGLVAIPSALGAAWLPWSPAANSSVLGEAAAAEPITEVPADRPEKGLVHRGLKPAKKGSPCVGKYEIDGTGECSHGPDQVPPGLDVAKDVAPVAPAAPAAAVPATDAAEAPAEAAVVQPGTVTGEGGIAVQPDTGAGSTTFAADGAVKAESTPLADVSVGPNGVVCDGDGTTGKRIQVLYVYEAGTRSRFTEYKPSFQKWAAGVDAIFDASAKETGGSRHLRYVTTADCQVDVQEVEVPSGALKDFGANMNALKKLGHNRADRKYMIFAESKVYCGIGTFAGDHQPGAKNASNQNDPRSGAAYGRSDSGCWTPSVAAHELGHNLGAVNKSAPHSTDGHCTDEYDVMCYDDDGNGPVKMNIVCKDRAGDQRLDCNHDDYYHTNPKPGSYLATHWNVADNQFLIKGDGGGTAPVPSPSVTSPAPKPSPTTGQPKPDPTTVSPSPTTASPSPARPSPARPSPTKASPSPVSPSPSTPAPSPSAADPNPGQVRLTVRDVQPNSARLSWPAAARGTKYGVVVDGRTVAWVSVTGVRLVGLAPGKTYNVGIVTGSSGNAKPYTASVPVNTPGAATPKPGTSFRLSNALTGTVADVYGGRSADRTPVTLDEANGATNQLWQLQPTAAGFRVVSAATGKCLSPVDGRVVAGAPLGQRSCDEGADQVFRITAGPAGLVLSTGDLAVGLGNGRFCDQRLLVLQKPNQSRQQAWAALPA